MNLADLIKGKKTAITLPPANANPAKVAKVDPALAVFESRLAGLATLALAETEPTDFLEELPTFDDDLKPAGIWDDWHLTTIPTATTSGRVCRCCKGTDFWLSAIIENHWTCRKCHPAAPGAEREE